MDSLTYWTDLLPMYDCSSFESVELVFRSLCPDYIKAKSMPKLVFVVGENYATDGKVLFNIYGQPVTFSIPDINHIRLMQCVKYVGLESPTQRIWFRPMSEDQSETIKHYQNKIA